MRRRHMRRRHMLHLGERSSARNRLPVASCRQCQAWVSGFGGLLPALAIGFRAIACRRGGSDGATPKLLPFRLNRSAGFASLLDAPSSPVSASPEDALALASCQRRSGIPLVSGLAGAVSEGSGCAAGVTSLSARMSNSFSRSDFAASFGPSAVTVLPGSCTASTAGDAGRITTLTAIAGPRPIRQKRAIHIVLVILDSKVGSSQGLHSVGNRGTEFQD